MTMPIKRPNTLRGPRACQITDIEATATPWGGEGTCG